MKIVVNTSYPRDPNFEYETCLTRINLDKEREHDINTANGFFITEPQSPKKDQKSVNSIYSSKYGPTLEHMDSSEVRYKCQCGKLKSRINNNIICDVCETPVKFVGDNFKYFGWVVLKDPYHIIHPNIFKEIERFIGGTRVDNMIRLEEDKDENGFTVEREGKPKDKDEPFYGIGLTEFIERFDEILKYYLGRFPAKAENYNNIMKWKSCAFIQSIPVFTALLRPFRVDGKSFHFEGTNAIYNLMAKLVHSINRDNLKIFRKKKPKESLLYDLQKQYMELYKEIENILVQKKGIIRQLTGGRYTMTSRQVIKPDPNLRVDEVALSYYGLVELNQQRIINTLIKSGYVSNYADAYRVWYNAQIKINPRVKAILENFIKFSKHGLPVLINRNPTIAFGGIMYMKCVAINDNYTMSVPLRILAPLAADFDGDCLNILSIINEEFREMAEMIFSPRNTMHLSMNDGMFNNELNHSRDTLITLNALINVSRHNYEPGYMEYIQNLRRQYM